MKNVGNYVIVNITTIRKHVSIIQPLIYKKTQDTVRTIIINSIWVTISVPIAIIKNNIENEINVK
jgi:hypothetical protein